MNRVSLQNLSTYESRAVRTAIEQVLAPLGGMTTFVKPGQRVLVKPNLLMAKPVAAAVTTHPEIVRAVIQLAQEAGGLVVVGDSPGIGQPKKVAKACGLGTVVEETGAGWAPFEASVKIPVGHGVFRHLEIAKDVLDADVVINLPKLKTHQMMGLTCGVKNMFGAIVGMRKPGLHLQAGADKAMFARMLIDLADRLAPALTLVDGVVGMEGDGPSSGTPVTLGVLMASASPLALDTVATELTGLGESRVWTQKVARGMKRPEVDLANLELVGTPLAEVTHPGIKPSKTTDVDFGLPKILQKPLQRSLTARPQIEHERCVRCGLCVNHCPPEVMTMDRQVTIRDKECIRCFCCQELCPHAAISTRQGLLLRLSRFLSGSL